MIGGERRKRETKTQKGEEERREWNGGGPGHGLLAREEGAEAAQR